MIDLAGPGDVRDVDHAVETFFQFDESTVACEVAKLAFDPRARREFVKSVLPPILQLLLQPKADPLFLSVDIEHHDVDFLANLQDLRWMPNTAPAHISN